MRSRTATLILAALVPLAACGSPPGDTAEPTASPTPASDVASQVPERPRAGTYVYDLIGVGGTASRVPDGSRLTEDVTVDGDAFTVLITNNQNPNSQRIELRWEESQVVQLTNARMIGGQRTACTYDPPLVVLRIPIRQEEYREQEVSGCAETTQTTVSGRQEIDDAAGKTWETWTIEVYSVSGGRTDEVTRWFSPALGRDIRIETVTEQDGRRTETAQLLRSYPSG